MRKTTSLLSPRVLLFPVISTVAGQEPVSLQDASGKPENGNESVFTARNWGEGICNKGGNSSGMEGPCFSLLALLP